MPSGSYLTFTALLLALATSAPASSRVCSTEACLMRIEAALVAFRHLNGRYPTQDEGLLLLCKPPGPSAPAIPKWEPFFERLPLDCWRREFVYLPPPDPDRRPRLYSRGHDGVSRSHGNDPDDINNWNESRPWNALYSPPYQPPPAVRYAIILSLITTLLALATFLRKRLPPKPNP